MPNSAPVSQMSFGLAVVVGLLFACLWLLRRLSARGGGAAIKVLGAAAVGPRERVVLVEIGEDVLVLGVAPGSVAPARTQAADLPADLPAPACRAADLRHRLAPLRNAGNAAMKPERRAPSHPGHCCAFALACALAGRPAGDGAGPASRSPPARRRRRHDLQPDHPDADADDAPELHPGIGADDNLLHPHRHRVSRCCARPWARRPRRPNVGAAGPRPLPHLLRDGAGRRARINTRPICHMSEGRIQFDEALERASVPLKRLHAGADASPTSRSSPGWAAAGGQSRGPADAGGDPRLPSPPN